MSTTITLAQFWHETARAAGEYRSRRDQSFTKSEMALLAVKIARLELEATMRGSRSEPDTTHLTGMNYHQICDEIVRLKLRLSNLQNTQSLPLAECS